MGVGARGDDDDVLRVRVDHDRGRATGPGHGEHPVGAHVVRGQVGQQHLGRRVRADGAHELHLRTGAGRGDRLVETFAARPARQPRSQHGFASRRQPVDSESQVSVNAAHDAHPRNPRHPPTLAPSSQPTGWAVTLG